MSAAVYASIRNITSASTIPGEPPTDSPNHTGVLKLYTVFTATANNSSASNIGENQSSLRDLIRHRSTQTPRRRLHSTFIILYVSLCFFTLELVKIR
ncbi:hypothetical protein Bca4012_096367 [Brassica carinata]|uniref:Uncharacterized protein n=2 Tax=Brassica TaxID=3705 RepID=A0A8X7PY81_BRACI|nr:hypothetical protein Bca52824_078667 [Brassica carinata]CAF2114485.1 unnamed protein product [Brassica napus]